MVNTVDLPMAVLKTQRLAGIAQDKNTSSTVDILEQAIAEHPNCDTNLLMNTRVVIGFVDDQSALITVGILKSTRWPDRKSGPILAVCITTTEVNQFKSDHLEVAIDRQLLGFSGDNYLDRLSERFARGDFALRRSQVVTTPIDAISDIFISFERFIKAYNPSSPMQIHGMSDAHVCCMFQKGSVEHV